MSDTISPPMRRGKEATKQKLNEIRRIAWNLIHSSTLPVNPYVATEEEKQAFWEKVGASLPSPVDYGVQPTPTTCPACGGPRRCCAAAIDAEIKTIQSDLCETLAANAAKRAALEAKIAEAKEQYGS